LPRWPSIHRAPFLLTPHLDRSVGMRQVSGFPLLMRLLARRQHAQRMNSRATRGTQVRLRGLLPLGLVTCIGGGGAGGAHTSGLGASVAAVLTAGRRRTSARLSQMLIWQLSLLADR